MKQRRRVDKQIKEVGLSIPSLPENANPSTTYFAMGNVYTVSYTIVCPSVRASAPACGAHVLFGFVLKYFNRNERKQNSLYSKN